ncbi:MAG: glycoside hydrolase family 65 protein, partial [Acidimicrobiaceae bacterium]|nr:glycoside hydrolase family 65 protein [Acidimicrobiaceae bacterium]
IRLLVDDELFDLRYGQVLFHERELDMADGVLRRRTEWSSPGHKRVKVTSTRLVSLVERAILAIEYIVEAVDQPVRIVLQSELVTNEQLPAQSGDPRVAAVLERPLTSLHTEGRGHSALLAHQTKSSGISMACFMDHQVEAPGRVEFRNESSEDLGRVTYITALEPGQRVRLVKFVGYGWSRRRSGPALRDQVAAEVAAAWYSGWEGLLVEQRNYLDRWWERSDIRVEGDPKLQHALRFSLFHILQASARAETRAIPAKGLTGPGYDGHAFWDTETYVLPVLTYTLPEAAADALRWRHSILPQARERAEQLGLPGVAFPWRTIAGAECSAYWPAGTAAFHINADIADAVERYVAVTGDHDFLRQVGVDLLVGTARLWVQLGYFADNGEFRIDGVTGPDEYSALMDNNVYTNLMAARNLLAAADAVEAYPEAVDGVEPEELEAWRTAAGSMRVPFDPHLGVHPQSDGFTDHEIWDFADTTADRYPLLLHYPYFKLYRRQVVKQADLVLALYKCGDEFSDEQKAADFAYYEALTVRDSSLSACVQSIIAAECGHLDLAYDYLAEAALMDLDDREHNTRDGLHLASLAGGWLAAVSGFGGMRDYGGQLSFIPRLVPQLVRLVFNLTWRGSHLRVEVTPEEATYTCVSGDPIGLIHHGKSVVVTADEPLSLPIPPTPVRMEPSQPIGRRPPRRSRHLEADTPAFGVQVFSAQSAAGH